MTTIKLILILLSRMVELKTEFTNTIYPYKIFAPDGRVFHSCYEIDISGNKY
jgi:hypothetical protein